MLVTSGKEKSLKVYIYIIYNSFGNYQKNGEIKKQNNKKNKNMNN